MSYGRSLEVYRALKRFFGSGRPPKEWFDAEADFPEQIGDLQYRDNAARDEALWMANRR